MFAHGAAPQYPMYYAQSGKGYPIIYLHGWGCNGSMFDSVVNMLPCYRNIVFDFNGFGNSPNPPRIGWNVTDYARNLHAAVTNLQLRHFTIVAHSFGCRVAMVLAAMYPDMVDGIILVAPAGLRKFSLKRWLKVRLYKLRKRLSKIGGRKPCHCGSDDYCNCSADIKNTFVKVVNQNLARYARKIKCPVLIVNGDCDAATPYKHAVRLHGIIRTSQLVQIAGDHFAFFRTPAAFAQTIKNFAG